MIWAMRMLVVAALVPLLMLTADERLYHWAQGIDRGAVAVWAAITELGLSGWVLVPTGIAGIGALLMSVHAASAAMRRGYAVIRDRALFIFAAVAATGLTAAFFKQVLGRARPSLYEARGAIDFELLAFSHKQAGFPSGHATSIVALAVALALLFPRFRWPALALGAVVAFSRVPVGAHYASDVVAGAALGGFGTLFLAERLAARGRVFDRTLTPLDGRGARAALRHSWRRVPRDPRARSRA